MSTKKQIKNIYRKIFPHFTTELGKELEGCESFLDLACGINTPIQKYSKKHYSVGVDLFEPSIEDSKQKGLHTEYCVMSVLDIDKKFKENSFDCVVALDLIEHLEKEEGLKLISMMEKIAKKKVIIFTPNGFLPQGEHFENKWQIHKSGWDVEEMQEGGYEVIGINGWKPLRGEMAKSKYSPAFFWNRISEITQLFTKNHPKWAFQLLCVKEIR
ncbi:MAG: SAM-dependent methyltransferase [Euryarchaeota archaeon HGW-Euryarchaeota-1]|nr:MAG: SAM-dependent methyltransferase [Euryarchaeota archaeon HGW-Euryarchaeota-1]